jgi:transcriptional regulator with XRE-family HTH domain
MKNSQEIGQRIRHCRRLTGLTRKEFCERHSIASATYSHWEQGKVAISEKTILFCTQAFLAEGINCSSEWLLHEGGQPPTVINSNNRHLPEKFFERTFENISPEISAFLDVQAYQKNNPGSVVHQVKNRAMLPLLRVGDYVGGVPLEKDKLHFAHRELCILEMEPKKYIVRTLHKQKNNYVLIASNLSASVINPLIIQAPPLSVIPIAFIRKLAISNFDRLDDGEDE